MSTEIGVFLGAREAASRLGVSAPRFYQMCSAGLIPHIRLGRSIKIPRPAFEEWLQNQVDSALASVQEVVHADAA